MITTDGVAKIVDFGLAKLRGRTMLTKTGSTLGTAAYMSPEQARGEPVDHRTDIWSLGVVLYEMLTGQLPFKGDYENALIYSILNADPEPLTALRTGVPMELERIVTKALAKKRDERYQHVDDMLVDLRVLRSNLPHMTTSSPDFGPSRILAGQSLGATDPVVRGPLHGTGGGRDILETVVQSDCHESAASAFLCDPAGR